MNQLHHTSKFLLMPSVLFSAPLIPEGVTGLRRSGTGLRRSGTGLHRRHRTPQEWHRTPQEWHRTPQEWDRNWVFPPPHSVSGLFNGHAAGMWPRNEVVGGFFHHLVRFRGCSMGAWRDVATK